MPRITCLHFILVILFLYSCQNNQSKEIKVEEPLPFPIVLDTIGLDRFPRLDREKDPMWFSTGQYNFNYIGKYKDTIYATFILFNHIPLEPFLDEDQEIVKPNDPFVKYHKYHIEWGRESPYHYSDSFDIEIQVNTSGKTANTYPVMLTNKESDTIEIGYGEVLPLIMEAKDKKGNWRPIEGRYTYGCGNGVGRIFLPPNEIVITLARIFKGDYKTQLRLKYGKNYSKPFDGSINYSQFEYEKRY